jgi:hypothetical protein
MSRERDFRGDRQARGRFGHTSDAKAFPGIAGESKLAPPASPASAGSRRSDMGACVSEVVLDDLDAGIRDFVRVLRDAGVDTLSSCEGRNNPGYHPERDGEHHGDWPYIIKKRFARSINRAKLVCLS